MHSYVRITLLVYTISSYPPTYKHKWSPNLKSMVIGVAHQAYTLLVDLYLREDEVNDTPSSYIIQPNSFRFKSKEMLTRKVVITLNSASY